MNRYLQWITSNGTISAILLLSLFLNVYGIAWSLPYPVPLTLPAVGTTALASYDAPETGHQSTAPDEPTAWLFDVVSPLPPLAGAKEGFSWGRWSGQEFTYPLAHYIILAAAYAPYAVYLLMSGGLEAPPAPGYPYGLVSPAVSLTVFELIARAVSVLMATSVTFISFLIGREVFGKRAGLFAGLFVAVCYPLIFYAKVPTLDVPYLFWFVLALYAVVLIGKKGQLRHYVWLGIFAGTGLATKDQTYALIILLPFPVLWFHYRRHYPDGPLNLSRFFQTLLHREPFYALSGFVVSYAVLNNLIFNWPRLVLHVQAILGYKDNDRLLDPSLPLDHVRLFGLTLYFLAQALTWPLFAICLVGLIYGLYRYGRQSWFLVLPLVSYYVLFIELSTFYVHIRHVMVIAVVLALFGGKLLADLTSAAGVSKFVSQSGLVVVFAYAFLQGLSLDLTFLKDSRSLARDWLAENVEAGAAIEVYSDTRLLPHFPKDFQLYRSSFTANNYALELQERQPDYIIVSEQEYRRNGNRPEEEMFEEARQHDKNFQALLAGDLGYELRANFKPRGLAWLPAADAVFGHNPRILVFERRAASPAEANVDPQAVAPDVSTAPAAPAPASERLDVEAEAVSAGWERLDTTGGGGQTAIAPHPTDPQVIYMASDNGGLFKTVNGGDSWFSVSSNLGAYRLGFVALDPLDPDVIYVSAALDHGLYTAGGSSGEIYRSLNGGQSWQFVTDAMGFQNSFPNQAALVLPYDPAQPGRFDRDGDNLSDVIVVGAWTGPADSPKGGIWRSQDEGQSFTHLALKDRNITSLRPFVGDPQMLFATTYEGEVYRSQDLGENWVNITGNLPLDHPAYLAAHPTNSNILYVTCRPCQNDQSPVWKTVDGGKDWQATSKGLDPTHIGEFPRILIDRFDPNTLYVTTSRAASPDYAGVYKSSDGGESWRLMPAQLTLPDGRPFFWYQFEGGLSIEQAADGRLFSGGGEGGWRYPDGDPANSREEWEPATIGVGNVAVNVVAVDPNDSAILYQGINDFGPYKSINRGFSFNRILGNGWPVTVANYSWTGPYYQNYEYCRLACSATCQAEGRISSGGTTDFAIFEQDSNIVYSSFGGGSGGSRQGGVNKSTDGGQTWEPVGWQLKNGFKLNPDTCLPYGFRHLAIHPAEDILFAAMEVPDDETGHLYKTEDGGLTWTEVYSGARFITALEISAIDPDVVVFTTWAEVYKSEEGGRAGSWRSITPPDARAIWTLGLSPHQEQVYVIGTNDQGLYYTADGGRSWAHHPHQDLFEQRLAQGSRQYLDPDVATAANPDFPGLDNVSAIVFDPVEDDVFYIGGTRYTRASFGVAKITSAGQKWQRLPLSGLSHRNVFDLAIDRTGTFLYAGTFDGIYRLKLR